MSIKYRRPTPPRPARRTLHQPAPQFLPRLAARPRLLLTYICLLIFALLLLFSKPSPKDTPPNPGPARRTTAIIADRHQAPQAGEAPSYCLLDLDLELISGQTVRTQAQLPCAAWERLATGDRVAVVYILDKNSGQPVVSEVGLVALPKSGQV